MRRQGRRDTSPEIEIRRRLHAMGLRFRLHLRPVPELRRSADIVFTRHRLAVFVDGCFWHACPAHGTAPKANSEWWRAKLAQNVQRDRDTDRRLTAAGWKVVRVWEHEEPTAVASTIAAALS